MKQMFSGFEVFTAVTMKNAVFWGLTPCGSYILHSRHHLLVTANVVPSSLILVTLMMQALGSSETSVLTRGTERNTPGDGILQQFSGFNEIAAVVDSVSCRAL
jgi:hypothetical protein